ncbi:MAG TPA: aspartate/glutamate racemase family protein [Burkholderiales bacterium]|jgi:Asp/Glu/hydantoin racemase
MSPRICLIHAVQVAMAPIENSFARLWPQAERMNLLEDRLAADRKVGDLTPDMYRRFDTLADYAISVGADGILYTCSAFGPAIESVQRRLKVPVFKPNEAMFAEALRLGKRFGLIATFEPSLQPMVDELRETAARQNADISITTACAQGAQQILQAGDAQRHHDMVAAQVKNLGDCDVILLAQFSMAGARAAVEAQTRLPVLTSPDSAVHALRAAVEKK